MQQIKSVSGIIGKSVTGIISIIPVSAASSVNNVVIICHDYF